MKVKTLFLVLIMITLKSCNKTGKTSNSNSESNETSFFVGTYTDGDSQGIYKYSLLKDGTLKAIGLVGKSENPSFLTKSADKKYLLAVNEINNKDSVGLVSSFLIGKDSLQLINTSSSGGAHPCFVSTNEAGFVLAANYTGGNVGLLKLGSDGALSGLLDVQQHIGSNTDPRQEGPHAHSSWFAPDNKTVISIDLGTNALWFSNIDTLSQKFISGQPALQMKDGAGPRHLAFHPNGEWIYVINELDATITLVKKEGDGNYKTVSSVSTLPEDYDGPKACADIHISWAGKFVYASNRGHDSIAIYEVNANDGTLKLIGIEDTHGKWPRNFSLSPDENYVLVANQYSNNISSFKRDKTTGLLEFIDEIEAPSPVCILF